VKKERYGEPRRRVCETGIGNEKIIGENGNASKSTKAQDAKFNFDASRAILTGRRG